MDFIHARDANMPSILEHCINLFADTMQMKTSPTEKTILGRK